MSTKITSAAAIFAAVVLGAAVVLAASGALANTKGPSGPTGHARPSTVGGTAGQKQSQPLGVVPTLSGNAAADVLAIAKAASQINHKLHSHHGGHYIDLRGKKFTVETYTLPKIVNGQVVGVEQKTWAGWK
jgi:hypothetical protein